MQHALAAMMAELGPHAIEQSAADEGGLAGLLTSRKVKLWDTYVAHWQATVRADERAPVDAFMRHFAEHYDRDAAEAPARARPGGCAATGTFRPSRTARTSPPSRSRSPRRGCSTS